MRDKKSQLKMYVNATWTISLCNKSHQKNLNLIIFVKLKGKLFLFSVNFLNLVCAHIHVGIHAHVHVLGVSASANKTTRLLIISTLSSVTKYQHETLMNVCQKLTSKLYLALPKLVRCFSQNPPGLIMYAMWMLPGKHSCKGNTKTTMQ